MNEFKVNDVIAIVNVHQLYTSLTDYVGQLGKIIELDPYNAPPIKVQFMNGTIFPFYEENVRQATRQESDYFNHNKYVDPWRTA
jgi:hypothetical protein